jgi:hypothetical protein
LGPTGVPVLVGRRLSRLIFLMSPAEVCFAT